MEIRTTQLRHDGTIETESFPRLYSGPDQKCSAIPVADHDLTLIIPAYNEEKRLPGTLSEVRMFLDDWGINYQVVVVDNGSSDNTQFCTNTMGHRFSTMRQPIPGKGAAVRKGIACSVGKVVAFTDADLPYDLESLRQGYQQIVGSCTDVVFGSRTMNGSTQTVQRKWLRTVASNVFQWVVRSFVSTEVIDTQCGLKMFSRAAAQRIFSRVTINGFAFDVEVVFLSRQLHLHQYLVPVRLINEEGTTISLTRQAFPMLLDVLKIRWQHWLGMYRTAGDVETAPAASTRRAAG